MGRLSAVLVLLIVGAGPGAADGSVLQNGAFTSASDGMPAGWRLEAWARDLSDVSVESGDDGAGVVRILNRGPNDARICQTVAVAPGAEYRVSARVRTESVGQSTAGALIAIEPRVADSVDLKGTQDWQRIEVRAHSGERTSWDVCLRLGSYANLNTGIAWFADVRVDLLAAPPRSAEPARPLVDLSRLVATFRRTPWMQTAVPVLAGVVLAFGLGIVGRRRR